MSVQEKADATCSLVRLLKDLYLSIFVVFYKFAAGLWPASFNADAHKGTAGVTLVEALLGLSAGAWFQIALDRHFEFSPLFVGAIFLVLYYVNSYFLVSCGVGTEFKNRFDSFSLKKRIFLSSAAVCICIISLITLNFSANIYEGVFDLKK